MNHRLPPPHARIILAAPPYPQSAPRMRGHPATAARFVRTAARNAPQYDGRPFPPVDAHADDSRKTEPIAARIVPAPLRGRPSNRARPRGARPPRCDSYCAHSRYRTMSVDVSHSSTSRSVPPSNRTRSLHRLKICTAIFSEVGFFESNGGTSLRCR